MQDNLFLPSNSNNIHTSSIFAISWSPNGHYLATGFVDTTRMVWQVNADEQ